MGKVGRSRHLGVEMLIIGSRFWFLTTLIGLWTLNTRSSAPLIHSGSSAESADGALALAADPAVNEVVHSVIPPTGIAAKRLNDARSLTQLKLLGDLAFVCEWTPAHARSQMLTP